MQLEDRIFEFYQAVFGGIEFEAFEVVFPPLGGMVAIHRVIGGDFGGGD